MQDVRGGQIAMIFQDPMTALNPVYTIGDQLMETILLHQDVEPERGVRDRHRKRSTTCRFPNATSGSTTTRTSSPAACDSG